MTSLTGFQLREMQLSDLPAVNRVLSKAFTSARIEEGYKKTYVPGCRLSFLEMYLASLPSGCLVMEHKGTLIGYAFTHLWGKVGWIGPVSIIPAHQGKRLGQEIMRAAIHASQKAGASVIGLETMPRNYRNLGFYSQLGFKPGRLTIDLIKRVPPVAGEALPPKYEARFYSQLEAAERTSLAAQIDRLARRIDPHLAISGEIELADRFKYGDALCVWEGENLMACVLGHTEPYSDDEAVRYLKIMTLLIAPGDSNLLSLVVPLLFDWAGRKNLDTVSIRTPTRYYRAYRALLALGFRVFHSELRMTLKGYHEQADPREFYLSKWE
jgi:ribosomal protein S18 acetylase RimI-like enzyme